MKAKKRHCEDQGRSNPKLWSRNYNWKSTIHNHKIASSAKGRLTMKWCVFISTIVCATYSKILVSLQGKMRSVFAVNVELGRDIFYRNNRSAPQQ